MILETAESDRRRHAAATVELVRFLLADIPANRGVVQEWLNKWAPLAVHAAQAFAPLFAKTEEQPLTFALAWQRVVQSYTNLLNGLGLQVPPEVH